jgi:tetratricopeptide (TPR) repeat protein
MAAEEGFDTAAVLSAMQSTSSLFSGTLQLASVAFQLAGMAGVAGVLGGVSSAFDNAATVLDGIDEARAACDMVIEMYDRHPDPAAHPWVADALLAKAFTLLLESGRPAEALSVYDDLARRFGADTDPSVARSVRWARINATRALIMLQEHEQALTRCGEVVERYGTDPDPAVVVDVLTARLNRMEALGELQRTDQAVSCCDQIVAICDGFDGGGAQELELRRRLDHVAALAVKSRILLQQDLFDAALAASDEIIERFGADQHPAIRIVVARSLTTRAALLQHFGRSQEEIDAYNQILAAYSKDRSLQDIAPNAGLSKVRLLLELRRFQDTVRACDDIRRRFRNDRATRITATIFEVNGYEELGQHKKVLKACDEVVDLIGSDPDVKSRRLIAQFLRHKVQSLWTLGRGDEALSACTDIDRRFGGDPDPLLRQELAQALIYKGNVLGARGRFDEAAVTMSTVVARYGEDPDPLLSELSARARSKLAVLGELGARADDDLPPA